MNDYSTNDSAPGQIVRSLKLGVMGLGQGGGLIASEFASLGYPTLAFNTSETDLRALNLQGGDKFMLSRKRGDGAGRDRTLGAAILSASAGRILETVQKKLSACDHLVICGGLAGGTGGNLGRLAVMLGELDIKVSALAALPRLQDGSVDKFNASLALGELIRAPLNCMMLIDNDQALEAFPSARLDELFRPSNRFIALQFYYFNRVSGECSLIPLQGFDGEDFNRVFSTRGFLSFTTSEKFIEPDDENYIETIERLLEDGSIWPAGYDYGSAKTAALILTAPKSHFDRSSGLSWGEWVSALTKMTKGCGCFFGLFQGPENMTSKLSVMIAGLNYPASVNNIIDSARIETRIMRTKLERDYDIDLSGLDKLVYFDNSKTGQEEEKVDTIIDSMEDDEVQSDEIQLDEIDFSSLVGEETTVKEPEKEQKEEESAGDLEGEIPEALNRRRPVLVFSILFAALLAIIATASYFYYREMIKEKPGVIVVDSSVYNNSTVNSFLNPAGFIAVNSKNNYFFIVVDKSQGVLSLYNSTLHMVRSYRALVGKNPGPKESNGDRRTPEGIYFPVRILRGDSLPPLYGPLAFVLNYPNPIDELEGKDGSGIWLHSYPGNPPDDLDTKGCIAVAPEDIMELSHFITLQRTPVMVYNKVEFQEPGSKTSAEIEIKKFILNWNSAWKDQDAVSYAAFYLENFHSRGMNKTQWLEYKKNLFRTANFIEVELDKLDIIDAGNWVLAFFEQGYKSSVYADYGIKRLYLRKDGENWGIIAEEWFPLQSEVTESD